MTHLGISSAGAAAARGFETVCFEAMPGIATLSRALPIVEPGLPERLEQSKSRRIAFTTGISDVRRLSVVYVSADVPTDEQGQSDCRASGR